MADLPGYSQTSNPAMDDLIARIRAESLGIPTSDASLPLGTTQVKSAPGALDLLPMVQSPPAGGTIATDFQAGLPRNSAQIIKDAAPWQDKLMEWFQDPKNIENMAMLFEALGRGVDKDNPMAPAAAMTAQGIQAKKQSEMSKGYLKDLWADALNPGTQTSVRVTPGKDGQTAKATFDLTYGDGPGNGYSTKDMASALGEVQEGTSPFGGSVDQRTFYGMTPEHVNAAISQAREIVGQKQTARLKELEQATELQKAAAQDHRTPWQKNWEDTFAPSLAKIEAMPEGVVKELNKRWWTKQAIGAGVLPAETKFEEARAAIEAVGGKFGLSEVSQVAGMKTPQELERLAAETKLAQAQAQPVTIKSPIDGTPMTVPMGIASELINAGKGPTLAQEYEKIKLEQPDRFPHFADYIEWYFKTQGDANMKSLARIMAENRVAETGRGMGKMDSPQAVETAKENALSSMGFSKPFMSKLIGDKVSGKRLSPTFERQLQRYKDATVATLLNGWKSMPDYQGGKFDVRESTDGKVTKIFYIDQNGGVSVREVTW